MHSTIDEKSVEHFEINVKYDKSEPQSDRNRQTSDKINVDIRDEGVISCSFDVPNASRSEAAIKP